MMNPGRNERISFEFPIGIPVEQVWQAWTDPGLILRWIGSQRCWNSGGHGGTAWRLLYHNFPK
jgi:uncharacterized protein YndB with AHSA1/START domain